MELERLELELRPRGPWQAVDLGFPLLRRHARTVLPAWLVLWTAALLPAVLLIFLFPQWQGAGSLLPWFLRPLLERLPLHMLSRGVFGEELSVRGALRAWPALCRDRWFSSLTWGRLVPARVLVRCVHQLEGAEGAAASERSRLLRRNGAGAVAGFWLVACAHFEVLLAFLPLFLLGLFLPGETIANPFALIVAGEGAGKALQLILLAGYWLAGAVVAPAFVSGSFTLYLERRSSLEAWDLELALRRLVRRHLPSTRALVLAVLGLSGLAGAGTCAPPEWAHPVRRAKAHDPMQARFRQGLDSLLADSAFLEWRCRETWVPRERPAPDVKHPAWLEALLRWLGTAGRGIGRGLAWSAEGVRLGLILLLLGAVLWLLWRFRGSLPRDWNRGTKPEPLLGRYHELEVQEDLAALESLCEADLEAGDLRRAVGHLYQACLLSSAAFPFPRGCCERQSLGLARQAVAERTLSPRFLDLLEEVVGQRELVRWAGGEPSPELVRELLARWKSHRQGEDGCVPA